MNTPIIQSAAFKFMDQVHRHLDRPEGGIICCGISRGGELVGVGVSGKPVAPKTAANFPACGITEILRVAVKEGVRGGNSKLYCMLSDIARIQGFWKIQTFTLASESGVSLKAAGFFLDRPAEDDKPRKPGSWSRTRPGRTFNLFGEPDIATEPKNRWVRILGKDPKP